MKAFLGWKHFVYPAVLLFALMVVGMSCAHAQSVIYVVRGCATKPATDGFDTCPAPVWQTPQGAIYLDVKRRNVVTDVWLKQSELVPGDRVYACPEPTIKAGMAWGSGCVATDGTKIKVPGQTDNWIDQASIIWGTAPPPSPGVGVTFAWAAPTTNTDGTPLTDLAGYRLSVKQQLCDLVSAGASCTAAAYDVGRDLAPITLKYTVLGVSFSTCISIQTRNTAGNVGPIEEVCTTDLKPQKIPGAVVGLKVESVVKP